MRIGVVLNRDGGTLKTTDLDAFTAELHEAFADTGHTLDVRPVASSDLIAALEAAGADDRLDALIAGGGDGTVSAAAGIAWKADKVFGVLPAGTMNLFARSLGLPLDLTAALPVLAESVTGRCDIATANGRPFVHQYSMGLQPRVISRREELDHNSRIGKLIAGTTAALASLGDPPPAFAVRLTLDGKTLSESDDIHSLIAVSNNPYGEGHIPYADRLDGGAIALYRAGELTTQAQLRLTADLIAGTWRDNPDLSFFEGQELVLEASAPKRSARASIDGELIPVESEVTIRIHPGALRVMMPADAGWGQRKPEAD